MRNFFFQDTIVSLPNGCGAPFLLASRAYSGMIGYSSEKAMARLPKLKNLNTFTMWNPYRTNAFLIPERPNLTKALRIGMRFSVLQIYLDFFSFILTKTYVYSSKSYCAEPATIQIAKARPQKTTAEKRIVTKYYSTKQKAFFLWKK